MLQTRVDSGLDGVIVADTVMSEVDGEAGRLVVRGHALEELVATRGFEGVAALLWDGYAEGGGDEAAVRERPGGGARAGLRRGAEAAGRHARPQAGRGAAGRHRHAARQRADAASLPGLRRHAGVPGGAAQRREGPVADRAGSDAHHGAGPAAHDPRPARRRGVREGARHLSRHHRRPRLQRLDLHRPGRRLDACRPDLVGAGGALRAQGPAAWRRARPRARHAGRDRRGLARRGLVRRCLRQGHDPDGLRPSHLQGARPARRRAEGTPSPRCRRPPAGSPTPPRSRRAPSRRCASTSPAGGSTSTSSTTPRCCSRRSRCRAAPSPRCSPSAAPPAGARTSSSRRRAAASSARSRTMSGRALRTETFSWAEAANARVGVSAVSASALVTRRRAVASRDFGTSRGFRSFRYPSGAFASLLSFAVRPISNSQVHPERRGPGE